MKGNFKFTLMVLSTFVSSCCVVQNIDAMRINRYDSMRYTRKFNILGDRVKTPIRRKRYCCNSEIGDRLNNSYRLDNREIVVELSGTKQRYLDGEFVDEKVPFEVSLTNKLSKNDKHHLYWYSEDTLWQYEREKKIVKLEVNPNEFCEMIDKFMNDKKRASEWKDLIMCCGHNRVTANIFKAPSGETITWFDIEYIGNAGGNNTREKNSPEYDGWLDHNEYRSLPEREDYKLYGLEPRDFGKLVLTDDGRGLWIRLNCLIW